MNNTIVRSISGTLFVIIMVGSLLLGPLIFAMVMLFCVLLMVREFLTISNGINYPATTQLTLIASALLYGLFYFYGKQLIDEYHFWILTPFVVAIPISIIYRKDKSKKIGVEEYQKSSFFILSIIYIALPFSLTNTILFDAQGSYTPYPLLSLFIILWSCDVGAYLFGMAFGQKNGHKLFPSISPKKSWEGFFGGAFLSLITAYILSRTALIELPLKHLFVITLLVFIFSVFGDLAESLFKRNFGVKDSGTIMPGHGGLLDRFDGALLAFPMAIAYIKLFKLI